MNDLPKMLVNPANMLFIFKGDTKNTLKGDFSKMEGSLEQFIKLFNDELRGSEKK